MKKFYKVVMGPFTNDLYRSPLGDLIYIPNKWTYPKIQYSKLFVFDSIEDADDFRDIGSSEVVFECEVKNPVHVRKICSFTNNKEYLKDYWKLKHQKKNTSSYTDWVGFVSIHTCDAVKLLKEVEL